MKSTLDLTVGNPSKQILLFGLPLLIGNVFQQLYNIVDTMIIGRHCGDMGLASIGAATPINYLLNNLTIGFSLGFSVIIAKYYGAHKEDEQKKSIATSIVLGLIIAVIFSILAYVFLDSFFSFTNTPKEIRQGAFEYISVIIILQIIPVIFNLEAGFLRAVGNSRIPVIALIIAFVFNIIGDYIFIVGLDLGLGGAAYATIISQFIAALICFVYINTKCIELHPRTSDFKLKRNHIMELLGMGFSTALTLSIVEIGTITLQGAINSFGPIIISSYTASRRLLSLATVPLNSMASATATFTGQNYGANKPERIFSGLKSAILLSFSWSLFSIIIFFSFGSEIIQFLTGTQNQELIQKAIFYLRIHFPLLFILSLLFIFRQTLQGLSDKRTPILSSLIEMGLKIVFTYALVPIIGYLGICLTEPLIWVACTFLLVISFYRNPFIIKRQRLFNGQDSDVVQS